MYYPFNVLLLLDTLIETLLGGFPCQPYSTAGKRKGKDDERHLWPEMLRAIREIQPRWVVGENVRGLVNWNGGMVFDEVQADLEAEGYEVQPFILPAAAVNAPHRRDRVWFVAYSDGAITRDRQGENTQEKREVRRDEESDVFGELSSDGNASNSDKERLQRKGQSTKLGGKRFSKYYAQTNESGWQNFPTESPICGGDDGLPRELDGITFSKWRNESIMAYGNAIVPQVVYKIFEAIQTYDHTRTKTNH